MKRPGRKRKAGSPPGEGDGERQWEIQLNIDRGHEAPIWIENSANPPEKFTYITQNLWGNNVPPTDESVIIGCHCHDNCDKSDTCCPRVLHGSDFPYTRDGLIQLELGQAIIECNVKCSCNKKCPNRVVQKGRKFEVVVFYTNNGKGWGLKSLVDIKAREFFSEYVGELVTSKEAEKREKLCDEAGMTYLLDLDFNEDKNAEFSIDAKQYGNASRFINHSVSDFCLFDGCMIVCVCVCVCVRARVRACVHMCACFKQTILSFSPTKLTLRSYYKQLILSYNVTPLIQTNH